MSDAQPTMVAVMYHYVRDPETTEFPGIKAISVDDFRRQVRAVADQFEMPSLDACLEFLNGTWTPASDLCVLTFDDGLHEHYEIVADVLAEARVPGFFFLPTAPLEEHEVLAVHMIHFLLASLGNDKFLRALQDAAETMGIALPPDVPAGTISRIYRWDDENTARLKYLLNYQLATDAKERLLGHVFNNVLGPQDEFARSLYLDWDQARQLQDAGFHVGGHTHRHRVLAHLTESEQYTDLRQSMSLLRRHLGEGARGFAYPYGKPSTYADGTFSALSDLGYACAFNTAVGRARRGNSRWEIPRIDPKDL